MHTLILGELSEMEVEQIILYRVVRLLSNLLKWFLILRVDLLLSLADSTIK